jgi:hypothetical protein
MDEKKISEIIIELGGDLISSARSLEEMQAHVNLVCGAWNMALHPMEKRISQIFRQTKIPGA